MGLNISVYRIIGKEPYETWSGGVGIYYNAVKEEWFDSMRHTGDREFVLENEFSAQDDESEYMRPDDFGKCREWVTNVQLVEGNKKRLLEALDRMEKDENLVFHWSW